MFWTVSGASWFQVQHSVRFGHAYSSWEILRIENCPEQFLWINPANRRAFCTRMRQYGLLKCHRGIFLAWNSPDCFESFSPLNTEGVITTRSNLMKFRLAFSVNCLRSVPAFAGCFLELKNVYWVLRSTNVFFKVSWYFYDESEFIVASLSPLRGQSFLS